MPRSRTVLSARHRRQVGAHNHRITHTATAESSNPHNVAPQPRGFVLGRFPYAGPVPTRATCDGRRPKNLHHPGRPTRDPDHRVGKAVAPREAAMRTVLPSAPRQRGRGPRRRLTGAARLASVPTGPSEVLPAAPRPTPRASPQHPRCILAAVVTVPCPSKTSTSTPRDRADRRLPATRRRTHGLAASRPARFGWR